MPNEYIDLIIADPPYNDCIKEEWDNQWETPEDYLNWLKQIVIEFPRILKPNGNIILYCKRQLEHKIKNILDNILIEQRTIIWARKRNINETRGKTLSSGYEPLLWYSKTDNYIFNNIKIPPDERLLKRKEYQKGGRLESGITLSDLWNDISALPHNAKEKTYHKTQKPLKLCDRLINQFSNEEDIIYIPFAGSGSEIESCIKNNRNYIATETNIKYINEIILPRIKNII